MAVGDRVDPYAQFNFTIELDGQERGGFTEVGGLTAESDVTPSPRPARIDAPPRRKTLSEHASFCESEQRRLKEEAAERRRQTPAKPRVPRAR